MRGLSRNSLHKKGFPAGWNFIAFCPGPVPENRDFRLGRGASPAQFSALRTAPVCSIIMEYCAADFQAARRTPHGPKNALPRSGAAERKIQLILPKDRCMIGKGKF
jgi:hypothetical protein